MIKKLLTHKQTLHGILLLAFFLPLAVIGIRLAVHPVLPGVESYYPLLTAEHIQEGAIGSLSALTTRLYFFHPYPYLLAISPTFFSYILPVLFSVGSALLLVPLSERLGLSPPMKALTLLLFVLSPTYLHLALFSDAQAMLLFINVLAYFLLLQKRRIAHLGALALYLLVIFFGPISVVLSLGIIIIHSLITRQQLRKGFISIILLASSLYYGRIVFLHGLPAFAPSSLLSELAGFGGFSIFALLLVGLGLIFLWQQKKKFYPVPFGLFFGAAALQYSPTAYTYLLIPTAMLSAYALIRIYSLEWVFQILQKATLIIVSIGIILSTFTFISSTVHGEPHQEQIEAMRWLQKQDGRSVLSHSSRGYWIEAIAQKQAYAEPSAYYPPELQQRQEAAEELFRTRNLQKAKDLLADANIDYIFIDREMRQGLVWQEPDEGLLFLFRNTETFKSVYSLDGVEIWKVTYDTDQ